MSQHIGDGNRGDHEGQIGLAYPLVEVNCVFSGDDITDGGSTFLAAGGLFRLGLWVVFDHFGGLKVSLVRSRSEVRGSNSLLN